MDLETLLVALYVLVEEWWEENRPKARRGPGRPLSLSDAEVLTLAILAQWPRFRSERDLWRFADTLCATDDGDLQGTRERRVPGETR